MTRCNDVHRRKIGTGAANLFRTANLSSSYCRSISTRIPREASTHRWTSTSSHPIKKQNSKINRFRNYGLASRSESNASGSGILPSFGEMLIECVDDHDHQVSDRITWAVSGDYDNANSPVTSGSLTSDMGEEWKNWCVWMSWTG